MSKMNSVLHLFCDVPGMPRSELRRAEAAMRDPAYMERVVQAINGLAKEHASALGLPTNFTITGHIHKVTHHD